MKNNKRNRIDIKKILSDPKMRKMLFCEAIIAIQAREGVVTTKEQSEAAYDKVQQEKGSQK